MHVLVHEIQNGEPESSKGREGQQRRKVLEENLDKHMITPKQIVVFTYT